MSSINQVTLLGNLCRDPDLSYTPSGKPVCKISLAVSNKYKTSAGAEVDKPLFIDVTIWNKQGEAVAQHKKKGDQVFVLGRLELDTWEDKNTKEKRTKIRCIAQKVVFGLNAKGHTENTNLPPKTDADGQPPADQRAEEAEGEDIPF